MSKKVRDERLNSFKKADKVISATNIANMDREISLYELAAMTRAGPAKCLGLSKDYGALKPGMNADIAIYNINPDKFPSTGPEIEKAFAQVAYLFKDGKICVEGGKVVDMGHKKTFWVDAKVKENKQVMHDIREKFLRYYSVNENNYPVPESYAPHQHIIAVDASQ
jgi:formylmethanofuran dehydrogenase subunit A